MAKKRTFVHQRCIFLVLSSFLLLAIPLSAQEKKETGKPDIKIRVEKETDEDGNITRYDSLYQWSWSTEGMVNIDSLFGELHPSWGDFNFSFPDFPGLSLFDHPFFSDSITGLFLPDLFGEESPFPPTFRGGDSLFLPSDSTFRFHSFSPPSYDDLMRRMEKMERRMKELQRRFFEHQPGNVPVRPRDNGPFLPSPPLPTDDRKKIRGVEI